jgi:CheY-like chemotaxis protein
MNIQKQFHKKRAMNTIEVIYIEDEEIEAQLFTIGMESHGITVLHIPDAQPSTLEILKTERYQAALAIFFDLSIGVVNGVALARSLREGGDKRPFFLVTAAMNPNPAVLKQLNLGYMLKPLDYNAIAEQILSMGGDNIPHSE